MPHIFACGWHPCTSPILGYHFGERLSFTSFFFHRRDDLISTRPWPLREKKVGCSNGPKHRTRTEYELPATRAWPKNLKYEIVYTQHRVPSFSLQAKAYQVRFPDLGPQGFAMAWEVVRF